MNWRTVKVAVKFVSGTSPLSSSQIRNINILHSPLPARVARDTSSIQPFRTAVVAVAVVAFCLQLLLLLLPLFLSLSLSLLPAARHTHPRETRPVTKTSVLKLCRLQFCNFNMASSVARVVSLLRVVYTGPDLRSFEKPSLPPKHRA